MDFGIFSIIKTFFRRIKKIPWFLATHAFLIMLFLILLNLVVGIGLFYQYAILPETKNQPALENIVTFKYTAYQEVTGDWQIKSKKFQGFSSQQYINPFIKPYVPPPTVPTTK